LASNNGYVEKNSVIKEISEGMAEIVCDEARDISRL
jgi:hypothetical protein